MFESPEGKEKHIILKLSSTSSWIIILWINKQKREIENPRLSIFYTGALSVFYAIWENLIFNIFDSL